MAATPFSQPEPWDLVASGYDRNFLTASLNFSEKCAALLELGDTPQRILDVACGPGTFSEAVREQPHEIDALDFSSKMIERLKQRVVNDRVGRATVRPTQGDGQALPFSDGTFDAAVSLFGLMFFPDRHRGLQEIHRTLKTGGRVCISSWLPISEVPVMRWMMGAVAHVAPPPKDAPPRETVLETAEALHSELSAAGFSEVDVVQHDAPFGVSSPEALWDTMVESSAPLALLRARVGEQEWARLAPLGKQFLTDTAPSDLSSLTLRGWLATGRK